MNCLFFFSFFPFFTSTSVVYVKITQYTKSMLLFPSISTKYITTILQLSQPNFNSFHLSHLRYFNRARSDHSLLKELLIALTSGYTPSILISYLFSKASFSFKKIQQITQQHEDQYQFNIPHIHEIHTRWNSKNDTDSKSPILHIHS